MTQTDDSYLDEYRKFSTHAVTILEGHKLTTLTLEDVHAFIDEMQQRYIRDGQIYAADFAPGVKQYVHEQNQQMLTADVFRGWITLHDMEEVSLEEHEDVRH